MVKKNSEIQILSVVKMEGQPAVEYLERTDRQKKEEMLGKVDLILASAVQHKTDDPKNPLFLGQKEYDDCFKPKTKTPLNDLHNQLYSTYDGRYHEIKSADITVDRQLPDVKRMSSQQIENAGVAMQTQENAYAGHIVRAIGIIDAAIEKGDIKTALIAFNARPDLVEHQPTLLRFVDFFDKQIKDVRFLSEILPNLCKDNRNLLRYLAAPTFSEDTRVPELRNIGKLEYVGSGIVKYRETIVKKTKEKSSKSTVLNLLEDEIKDGLQVTARWKREQFDGVDFYKAWRAEQDRQPKPNFEGEMIVRFMETDFCKGQKEYVLDELKEKLLIVTLEDISEFTKHPPEYSGAQEMIMGNIAKQIVLLTEDFDTNLLKLATESLKKERPMLGQSLETKVKSEVQKVALVKANEERMVAEKLESDKITAQEFQKGQEQQILQEKQAQIEKEFVGEIKGGRVGGILRNLSEGGGFVTDQADRADVVNFLRESLTLAKNRLPEPEGRIVLGIPPFNRNKYSKSQIEKIDGEILNWLNDGNREKIQNDDTETVKQWLNMRVALAYAKSR